MKRGAMFNPELGDVQQLDHAMYNVTYCSCLNHSPGLNPEHQICGVLGDSILFLAVRRLHTGPRPPADEKN